MHRDVELEEAKNVTFLQAAPGSSGVVLVKLLSLRNLGTLTIN